MSLSIADQRERPRAYHDLSGSQRRRPDLSTPESIDFASANNQTIASTSAKRHGRYGMIRARVDCVSSKLVRGYRVD